MMLDLHRLRLLRELDRHKTIAATAKALGYSPSAVSQQLAKLERETATQLLDRSVHRVELTHAGAQLVERAKQILDLVDHTEIELHAENGIPSGLVTVGAFPTAAVAFAPKLVRGLRQYPGLKMLLRQIQAGDGISQVSNGEIDIAMVDEWGDQAPRSRSGLHVHHLFRDPLVLVLPHGHPRAEDAGPIDVTELSGESWLATPTTEPSRSAMDRLFADLDTVRPVEGEFEGLGTILSLVSHGVGIAFVPASALRGGQYSVVARGVLGRSIARDIYVVTRSSRLRSPAIAATMEAIYTAALQLAENPGSDNHATAAL